VEDADEIFAITSAGVVIRMSVEPLRYLSRGTGGVKLVTLDQGTTVVAVAHNGELDAEQAAAEVAPDADGVPDAELEADGGVLTDTAAEHGPVDEASGARQEAGAPLADPDDVGDSSTDGEDGDA
jgi:DNA gyrase subunit A